MGNFEKQDYYPLLLQVTTLLLEHGLGYVFLTELQTKINNDAKATNISLVLAISKFDFSKHKEKPYCCRICCRISTMNLSSCSYSFLICLLLHCSRTARTSSEKFTSKINQPFHSVRKHVSTKQAANATTTPVPLATNQPPFLTTPHPT